MEGGFSEYQTMVSALTVGLKDIADVLWFEGKVWYEDFKSDWMFFVERELILARQVDVQFDLEDIKGESKAIALSEPVRDSLNYFLNLEGEYILLSKDIENSDEPQIVFYNCPEEDGVLQCREENFKFCEPHFNELVKYLKTINWIDTSKTYEFTQGGNRRAKEFMLKQNYKKRNKTSVPEGAVTFSSIVSSVISKGVSYKDIWDFPIYMVYETFYRLTKIEEYNATMQALYAGAIDTKKTPVNMDKINWSAVL